MADQNESGGFFARLVVVLLAAGVVLLGLQPFEKDYGGISKYLRSQGFRAWDTAEEWVGLGYNNLKARRFRLGSPASKERRDEREALSSSSREHSERDTSEREINQRSLKESSRVTPSDEAGKQIDEASKQVEKKQPKLDHLTTTDRKRLDSLINNLENDKLPR